MKTKFGFGGIEDRNAQDIGGQEIRGELEAFEVHAAHGDSEGFGEGRFARAGVVFEEKVASADQAGEYLADGFVLSTDDGGDGGFDLVKGARGLGGRHVEESLGWLGD